MQGKAEIQRGLGCGDSECDVLDHWQENVDLQLKADDSEYVTKLVRQAGDGLILGQKMA